MGKIKELIEEYCEYEGFDYRGDYSGRHMYGKKCVGIVFDNPLRTLSNLFAYLVDCMEEDDSASDICEALGNPRQDSMGMGNVLYFPNLETEKKTEIMN